MIFLAFYGSHYYPGTGLSDLIEISTTGYEEAMLACDEAMKKDPVSKWACVWSISDAGKYELVKEFFEDDYPEILRADANSDANG